jgi:hypothetical protein
MKPTIPAKTSSTPAFQVILGVMPFLIYGLICIWMHFGISSPRLPIWLNPLLVFDALVLIGLEASLLAGSPRWAYSYLWWALILTWWLSAMGIAGVYKLDNRMWLLLLGVLVLSELLPGVLVQTLLVRHSFTPLRALLAGLWNDWTLLSLGIYCFFSWISVMYDENHHPYLLVFILASTLAVSAGAWFYFRQSTAIRRVLSLIAGLIVLMGIGGINNATWDWRAYYHLPENVGNISPVGVALVGVIFVLMYLTGYFSQKRRNSHNKPTGSEPEIGPSKPA